jgi:MFS family permease
VVRLYRQRLSERRHRPAQKFFRVRHRLFADRDRVYPSGDFRRDDARGFPLGFFASGIFSGMGPVLTELFPTSVRGAGQGFCYNFGRGIGAFFPTLVGLLSASVTLGTAIGIFAAISYAIVIIAALALPETRGRELLAN